MSNKEYFHGLAIQIIKGKVNTIKRNLNACKYVSPNSSLLKEYYMRAKQLSIMTGEPVKSFIHKNKRKKIKKSYEKSFTLCF